MRRFFLRLARFWRPGRAEPDLAREVTAHLRLLEDDLRRRDMKPDEAARAARIALGGVEQTKELHRDARSFAWLDDARRDVRYALRGLGRTPGFAAVAILTLALGIGANVAIFAVVNAVLLQPLPFRDPDRLVRVFDDLAGANASDVGMSVPEFEDLRDHSGAFEQLGVIFPADTALSGGDHVERVELLGTTPNYFELLGARPALGRVYGQSEWRPGFLDGVVISDGLWKRQFGADPRVIGRQIRVDEDPYTIIGVMPPGFRHPGQTLAGDVDIWAAAGFRAAPFPSPPARAQRILPGAIARLAAGLTLDQAQQRVDALVARLRQTYPQDYSPQLRWSVRLLPAQQSLTGRVQPMLVLLLIAVSFVLLMVCVNVASLLLARSSARQREFAIRQALGASRGRFVRQVLVESVVISLAGGAAAVLSLASARSLLLALMPADVPRLVEIHADGRMMTFALALSVVTGVLFGLAPALHASRIDPIRDLNEGGRSGGSGARQHRSRAALVVLEVALSVVLLIGAGLVIRSFSAMLRQSPGFDPRAVAVGQIWIPVPNNPRANPYLRPATRAQFAREVLGRLAAQPGIEQAAIGSAGDVPFLDSVRTALPFSFADDATSTQRGHAADVGGVSPDYFAVMHIPLVRGRVFTDRDAEAAARVVIVNEAFARTFSPRDDPVGRRIRTGAGAGTEAEIIGVVGDVRDAGLDVPARPRIYASVFQAPSYSLAALARTRVDGDALRDLFARTIHGIDPELPVFGVRTMDDLTASSMARQRFALLVMSAFAAGALLLATLGIYGVVAFVVNQRVQEFGLRLALGARPRDVLLLAIRPAVTLACAGGVAGLAVAFVVTRLMSALLFNVSATDPVTFAVVPGALALSAGVACLGPARRALRVSPMRALRG